jgi:hypothetical protein
MTATPDERRIVLPIHDRSNPPTPMIDANDPDLVYREIAPL